MRTRGGYPRGSSSRYWTLGKAVLRLSHASALSVRCGMAVHIRLLPSTYVDACSIEQPLVIERCNFGARLRLQQFPEWLVHVVHLQVLLLVLWRDLIRAEEKAVRMLVEETRGAPRDFRVRHDVLRDFVPGDVEVHMAERRIIDDAADDERHL